MVRAESTKAKTCSAGWTRWTAFWTSESKSWTPKLQPVEAQLASSARRSALTVRGSTSMEYSPPGREREAALEHGHQLTQPIIRQERGGCRRPDATG